MEISIDRVNPVVLAILAVVVYDSVYTNLVDSNFIKVLLGSSMFWWNLVQASLVPMFLEYAYILSII